MAKPTCDVDECDNTGRIRRGWCNKHYQRWRAHDSVGDDGLRSCCDCDSPFVPVNAKQKRCTTCRANRKRSGKHRVIGTRTCGWCGQTFEVRTDAPNAKGCSQSCGNKIGWRDKPKPEPSGSSDIKWRQCSGCLAWLTTRSEHECPPQLGPPRPPTRCLTCERIIPNAPSHQRYCSRLCRDVANYGRSRPVYIEDCRFCGETFTTRYADSQHCSQRCSRQARRRRSGHFVVPDPVRQSIYERDAWRCQLCGKRVGKKYPTNHSRAPSLDHILPQSLGGTDDPNNLQLAHRICNSLKCDAAWQGGEQLTLVAA